MAIQSCNMSFIKIHLIWENSFLRLGIFSSNWEKYILNWNTLKMQHLLRRRFLPDNQIFPITEIPIIPIMYWNLQVQPIGLYSKSKCFTWRLLWRRKNTKVTQNLKVTDIRLLWAKKRFVTKNCVGLHCMSCEYPRVEANFCVSYLTRIISWEKKKHRLYRKRSLK